MSPCTTTCTQRRRSTPEVGLASKPVRATSFVMPARRKSFLNGSRPSGSEDRAMANLQATTVHKHRRASWKSDVGYCRFNIWVVLFGGRCWMESDELMITTAQKGWHCMKNMRLILTWE
eukprot:6184007-Pleurochrysis_carterae.AAC.4